MRLFLCKISILLFISFIFQSCTNFKTLKSSYSTDDQPISEDQLLRLSNYLDGELHSYELKRNVFAYPMAFLISENGNKSIVLACEGIINECNNSVHIYQLIQRYKKKFNQDIKILAFDKNILSKNAKAKIKKKKIDKIAKSKENIFYDLILIPNDNCGGDDC